MENSIHIKVAGIPFQFLPLACLVVYIIWVENIISHSKAATFVCFWGNWEKEQKIRTFKYIRSLHCCCLKISEELLLRISCIKQNGNGFKFIWSKDKILPSAVGIHIANWYIQFWRLRGHWKPGWYRKFYFLNWHLELWAKLDFRYLD